MEFQDAALPVVRIRVQPLRAVHPQAHVDRWRTAMDECGLLTEIFEAEGDEDPRAMLQSIQAQLSALSALEVKRAGLKGGLEGVQWSDAPWWAWLLVFVVPAVASALGLGSPDSGAPPFLGMVLLYAVPAIGALGLIAYGWSRFYRRRSDGLRELEELNHERMMGLRRMKSDIVRLAKRTFIARVGNRVLLCTGDLDWLRERARSAREAGQAQLAAQLDQEGDRIESALQAGLFVPPRSWCQAGFVTDRERWGALLEGVGLAA